MGENQFSMRVRSRISELCQCMGIINTLSKLQIEMAFKRCMLEVTFHVNWLDLTYANIWQTLFTGVDIQQWLRRFPEERYA